MTFAEQHDSMVELADAIITAARESDRGITEVLALRFRLSKEIRKHVDEETALIRSRREGSGTVSAAQDTLISKYHDELLLWRQQLADCNVAWTPKRIAKDPSGFVAEFQPLRDALRQRVQWEEQVFYPRVLTTAELSRLAA
jgi:hypothetical protein